MEQKILAQSSHYNIKKLSIIISIITAAVAISLFALMFLNSYNLYSDDYYCEAYYNNNSWYSSFTNSGRYYDITYISQCSHMESHRLLTSNKLVGPVCTSMAEVREKHPTVWSYMDCCGYIYEDMMIWGMLFGIPMLLIIFVMIFLFTKFSKESLTATNKRIYGHTAFGKKIDFTIDKVSTVGTCSLWGIEIGTSSGKIKFNLLKNRDEMLSIISELLMEKQTEKDTQTHFSSSADELDKYKHLLDKGVITQEEFDAKKKQLLGL